MPSCSAIAAPVTTSSPVIMRTRMCAACCDGEYPIPLPDDAKLGKYLLEGGSERGVAGPAEPVLPTSYGAADALRRP